MEDSLVDKLVKLQTLLIDELMTQIQSGEVTPSTLGVAARLLKDHGVTGRIDADSDVAKLMAAILAEKPDAQELMDEAMESRDL